MSYYRRRIPIVETDRRVLDSSVGFQRDRRNFLCQAAFCAGSVWELMAGQSARAEPADVAEISRQQLRLDLISRLWSVPIQPGLEMDSRAGLQTGADTRLRAFTASPLVDGERVLIQDAAGVRCIRLETGEPVWPVDEEDSGLLLAADPFQLRLPEEPGNCTGAIANGRWIGSIGRKLIMLDLSAEGRIVWVRRLEELTGDERSIGLFAGSPLVLANTIIMPTRTIGEGNRARLVCLDWNGEVQWRTGPVSTLPFYGNPRPDAIGENEGTIYWNLGGTGIVSVDAANGRLLWQTPIAPSLLSSTPGDRLQSGEWAGTALLVLDDSHDHLIVALSSSRLFALQPRTGEVLWHLQLPFSPSNLTGVHDGKLIVAGNQLCGVDLQTGSMRWQVGTADSRRLPPCPGVLAGGTIFWGASGELWTVSPASGRIEQRDAILQVKSFPATDMILAGETLLISSRNLLTACRVQKRFVENESHDHPDE